MERKYVAERAHPTPWTYVKVAIALLVLTIIEVGVFYMDLGKMIIPIMLFINAVDFVLIALFYMHLKFDSRIFAGLFVGGLLVAAAVVVALMGLFGFIGGGGSA